MDRVLYEGAVGGMYIDYKNGAPQDYYRQFDLTLMANYYYQNNWTIKGGVHNIWSKTDTSSTNYDPVFKLGLQYYEYLKYNIEGDLYVSTYDDFNVYQVTLKYGENFKVSEFPNQSFYAEFGINQIHIDKSGYAPKRNYTNADLKFAVYDAKFNAALKASLGKNAYKVDQDGWVVYNLGEEYKYSVGAEFTYYLDKRSSLRVGYTRSKFNENTPTDSYANTFLLAYFIGF